MHPPIAALGRFLFSPSVGSFEEMERTWDTHRASLAVIGRRNVKHWMGPTDEYLRISGSIWPEIQLPGLYKIDDLGSLANSGTPLAMLMGNGQFLGTWGLCNTVKSGAEFQQYGFPGEIGFELELERV